MYHHDRRLARLETLAEPKPIRQPDPRYHGTPEQAAWLKARTIEELEDMESAWRFMDDGGNVTDVDVDIIALINEWDALKTADS